MKKIIVLILSIVFLCGCSKTETEKTIITIVEDNTNTAIAINYPITTITTLDKHIKNYVNNTLDRFNYSYDNIKLNEKAELNIDYTYNKIDTFINITITTFINSPTMKNPINEIKTFVFDEQNKKIISIKDIINETQLSYLINHLDSNITRQNKECIKEYPSKNNNTSIENFKLFTFDYNNLTLYFNPDEIENEKCNIIRTDIPLIKLNPIINIENNNETTKENIDYVSNIKIIDPDKPVIALTFDDGPSKYTKEILDILNEYDANATFFVLGNKVEIYKETMKKSIKLGNEIGNHSYNHKLLSRLDIEELQEQIDKTQKIIKDVTGYTPITFRPTYGSVNKKIRNNIDLKIVLWNFDTMDWKTKNSKKIANRVIKNVEDGDIILMHDTYKRTLEAIKIIVPKLTKQGYQFVTVSTLEEIKNIRNNSQK